MNLNWRLPPTWLRPFIVILLIFGIFFRFTNLEKKVYWQDEAATSLRISGSSLYKVYKQEFDGDLISTKDLQKYVGLSSDRKFIDVIKSLAGNPEHTPLYYLMARFWMQLFGHHSVLVMRSLPALISLLSLPCIYWLCLELFELPIVGWIAIALLSVSPFHVLYAQEARQYSLWTLTVLLASAALLRAMRLKTKISWGIYTATLTLALYTHVFSGLVAIGHAIYVIANNRFRFDKTLTNYLVASLISLLAFMPWGFIMILRKKEFSSNTAWLNKEITFLIPLKQWFLGLISIFFDPNGSVFGDVENGVDNLLIYLIRLPILILIGYSIYFIFRHTPKRIWLFILTLTGIIMLVVLLPSLILGKPTAGTLRYQIPIYLGIQLTVAYLLATKIQDINLSQRKIWQVILAVLITCGVVSCAISSQAEVWWNKDDGGRNLQVARLINQTTQPLLISSDWVSNILSLSYMLDPKVRLQLVIDPNIPKIPEGFSEVFLFNSSKKLRNRLETRQNYKIEPIKPNNLSLWKLTKLTR